MSAPDIAALDAALRAGDALAVRRLVSGLDEAGRRACRTVVQAAVKRARSSEWVVGRDGALAVARAGTCGGPAEASELLVSAVSQLWSFQEHRNARAQVVPLLLERRPPWLGEVVERAAAADPGEYGSHLPEVEELRVALGLARPRTDHYLRYLARTVARRAEVHDQGRGPYTVSVPLELPPVLGADPELLDLLPDLLCVPDIGVVLSSRQKVWEGREERDAPPAQTWPGALRTLSDEGLLDRADLLDLVLDVLGRGGHRDHLALFLLVHDALEPSAEEVRERWRAYVAVLRDGSSTAATRAQALLRAVPGLDLDAVLQASAAVLSRREKGLAVQQLTWLEKRAADGSAEVLEALTAGLTHERADVQERALALAVRLVERHGGPVPEALGAAAQALPPLLRAGAGALLPGEPVAAVGPGAAAGPARSGGAVGSPGDAAPGLPGPLPAPAGPVRDLRGLVEAAAEHLETGDPHAGERVLQGIALLCGDPVALLEALAPLADRELPGELWDVDLRSELPVTALVRRAGGAEEDTPAHDLLQRAGLLEAAARLLRRGHRDEPQQRGWPVGDGALGVLAARSAEVADALAAGRPFRVLARPDLACGLVDPDRLRADLEHGDELRRVDLEQALLRLPEQDEGLRAALRAAAGGPVVPPVPVVGVPAPDRTPDWPGADDPRADWSHWDSPVAGLPVADVALPEGLDRASLLHRALSGGPPLPVRAGWQWWQRRAEDPLAVLLALPTRREVAAAHLVARAVHVEARLDARDLQCLTLLPDAEGSVGRATALALGYALASKDLEARTAAGDALVGLLLPGELDAALAGQVLAELLAHDAVKPGRVATALTAVLPVPGAAGPLWALLAAALPDLLSARRRGLHELLALAATTADAARARGAVPGLGDLASERGSSRLVVEARRLAGVLAA